MAKTLRLPISNLATGSITLPEDAARYVVRVHRLGVGDPLVMFDPAQGTEAEARVHAVGPEVRCTVASLRRGTRRGFSGLRLLQCLGKGDKAEAVIRDATALGVGFIQFVQGERSVSKLTDKSPQKLARYQSVALQAARQCLRSDVPVIEPLARLSDYLADRPPGVHWVLHPGAEQGVAEALARLQEPQCTLCIGPEGGFSAEELAAFAGLGAVPLSLGPLVLRTETAATVACALISARLRVNTETSC